MRLPFLTLALVALATAASAMVTAVSTAATTAASFVLTLVNLVPQTSTFRFTNEHPRSPLQSMRAGLA